MLGGLIATDILLLVLGLLVIFLAMGAGVWVWIRRVHPLRKKEQPEQATVTEQ